MRLKQHRRKSGPMRAALIAATLLSLAGIAPAASAGQWVQTGRFRYVDTESISPYITSYGNNCQGGVPGPSGLYTYGDIGPERYGSCPTDASTGWEANVDGNLGLCRPDLNAVGGGTSCVDHLYAIIGVGQYQGMLPATCATPGTYAIGYRRTVQLIDSGVGTVPDYYEQISETSTEYYCQ
ncbi:hypothetical protein [Stenotrophomonas rhizophila]|uniref:hypothetical protein n=1 Tax=Stenotrophomonas rhizophila TaxID=216778 RepID=UPI0028D0BF22|nr:hypothetical protein [Stenotrophomonas rhizophila]